ncbi:MAG: glycosyltransferase [Bacteroidia bacterium]|nr:glycosyltransferase [Bacteroidia bacterium]
MKILYVFGGIPPYANSLLNKLADKGVEITAVIPPQKSTMIGKGVKVTGGEDAKYKIVTSEERKSILGKTSFGELPSIIDTEKPDIFVIGWPFFLQYFTQPALRKALKDNNTKFVLREIPFQVPPYGKLASFYKKNHIYDEDMNLLNKKRFFYARQWIISHIRKYCYSGADGAVVYASVGKDILPTYGISRERVFVAYNSNNSEELLQIKEELSDEKPILPQNNHRVMHIGRLVKWKRVDLLMDAFAKVLSHFPDAELLIVGGGPEMENLQRRAHDLNITGSVIFTREVYDNKLIAKYFLASSVYVLAGMGGLSINDAMTFSLPVICSVCDGTERDLVSDGVNGFFFKENDAEDLAKKIITLFKNPGLRKKMGEHSFGIIENKVNVDAVSDRYIGAYKTILSE